MKIRLNLLPPLQKKLLRTKYVFRTLLDQFGMLCLLLVVTLMGLGGVNYVLGTHVSALEHANKELVSRADYAEVLMLHETFRETNENVSILAGIQAEHFAWEPLLVLLSNNTPPEIMLEKMSTNNTTVSVRGTAKTASALVEFQEAVTTLVIRDQQCFNDVDVDDKFLVNLDDVDFVMTFELNVMGCMKQQHE